MTETCGKEETSRQRGPNAARRLSPRGASRGGFGQFAFSSSPICAAYEAFGGQPQLFNCDNLHEFLEEQCDLR